MGGDIERHIGNEDQDSRSLVSGASLPMTMNAGGPFRQTAGILWSLVNGIY
jgi:hypothetical protein